MEYYVSKLPPFKWFIFETQQRLINRTRIAFTAAFKIADSCCSNGANEGASNAIEEFPNIFAFQLPASAFAARGKAVVCR